jgi:hypothetical protein
MTEKSRVIAEVCAAIGSQLHDHAISLLKREYPFASDPVTKPLLLRSHLIVLRQWTPLCEEK